MASVFLGQAILYWPSLTGQKILLPLNNLAGEGFYLPSLKTAERPNRLLNDLIFVDEPARRFAGAEIRLGRLPLWSPYQYAGAPFNRPLFSPFLLLEYLISSPLVLAWAQLLVAMVAGMGMYQFCRRALDIEFWPAVVAGGTYPLTGYFVFWQGYLVALAVCWLPWLLMAVDEVARRRRWWGTPMVGLITALVLISGQLDVAGQVLLISGLYALWWIGLGLRSGNFGFAAKAAGWLVAGWLVGFLLASPAILPVLAYSQTGARMERRLTGQTERPPGSLKELPRLIFPDAYGRNEGHSVALDPPMEGAATSYAGLFSVCLLAPLAWRRRDSRLMNWLLAGLATLGVSWCLGVPGVVTLVKLPVLNLLSPNRLTFATGFALLALAASGLDCLGREPTSGRLWFWMPAGLLCLIAIWSAYQAVVFPDSIAQKFLGLLSRGKPYGWIDSADKVESVRSWFAQYYTVCAAICVSGALLWSWIGLKSRTPLSRSVIATGMMAADLVCFAYGRRPQCDPKLYYPPIPALEDLSKASRGRVLGFGCLPANVLSMAGLRDVRGYDGVDPARLMDLMSLARPNPQAVLPYAQTQFYTPLRVFLDDQGTVQLPPLLDLLNVQYVVFLGTPKAQARPVFQSPDFWVVQNRSALARAFVPTGVEIVTNSLERLNKMGEENFNPSRTAFAEAPVDLPKECAGSAEAISDNPARIEIKATMKTRGLVVLSELWDPGWRAYRDGQPIPVLRVDHALQGVVLNPGASKLVFCYEPEPLKNGFRLALLGASMLLGITVLLYLRRERWVPTIQASLPAAKGSQSRPESRRKPRAKGA